MKTQPNNVISLTTEFDRLYRYWFEILEPFHHLTNREIQVISLFVKHRLELSEVIKDNDILDKNVMGEDVKPTLAHHLPISRNESTFSNDND
mgnify:CR=1 FL=1